MVLKNSLGILSQDCENGGVSVEMTMQYRGGVFAAVAGVFFGLLEEVGLATCTL